MSHGVKPPWAPASTATAAIVDGGATAATVDSASFAYGTTIRTTRLQQLNGFVDSFFLGDLTTLFLKKNSNGTNTIVSTVNNINI
jgi:hypothetical protein